MSAVNLVPISADAAAPAGLSPPQVGAPRAGGNGKGRGRDQGTADTTDCAGGLTSAQPDADDGKRYSTLRARLALAGWALTRSDASDGPVTYHASRWGMVRELASVAAVSEFADRVGAP